MSTFVPGPNPLSPDSEKNSVEFGLKVLRSCYNRWKKGYAGESWDAKCARFNRNRLYASGKQPTEQFRDIVKVQGQIAVVNLDYAALAIAVPLLNTKKDRYMQRLEKIRCRAVDPITQNKKKSAKDNAKFKMNYAPAIQELQQHAGMQLEQFSDDDPKSERELNVRFGYTYKEQEELVMEMGMNMVFQQNEWADVVKDRLLDDIFNCGYGVTLTELDGQGWIKTPYVSPESFITSYSEWNDFRDWQWQGQRRSMSITEIRQRYPGKISEAELFSLAQTSAGKWGNDGEWGYTWSTDYNSALARPYDNYNVIIVDLYYKTLYNLSYEKKTNSFGREILKKAGKGTKEVEKSPPYYVAYHGVWIVDTEYVLEWALAENMLKPNNNLVECRSPYSIHMHNNNKCKNTPLVETMIPSIDMMQLIHLQSQKIIAMTAPDGFNIDLMGLANMDMGQGVGIISPMQAFGIYLQTGNQYFIKKELDGEGESQPPIQPQNHAYSNKLEQLEAKWQAEYIKLQRITGDNNLSAGAITNQAVANSTLNDAREMSESAANYNYNSYLSIYKGTAKNVEILLLDKFFLKDESFNGYNTALGADNVEYIRLEGGDQFGQLVFDTKIDVVLDDSEQQKWDRRIEIALEQGQITIADVAELELIENPTYRAFMLAQKAKEKQAMDMKISQANAQNNTEQAKAAADAKGQNDQATQQQAHAFKMQQLDKEQEGEAKKQAYEGANILKEKAVTAILSKEGATWKDIPPFFWQGLGVTDEAQKAAVFNALQGQQFKNQQQTQQIAQAQQQQVDQSQQWMQQRRLKGLEQEAQNTPGQAQVAA